MRGGLTEAARGYAMVPGLSSSPTALGAIPPVRDRSVPW